MQFLFFNAADQPRFLRMDAEQAAWTVEEMQLSAVFPYDPARVIQRGQRVGFTDEVGIFQPFEIRKVELLEPDHYQRITAEHIVISELTDEHYGGAELENVTAQAALAGLLSGTLWQVGTVTASGTSSADLSMGSVWQNVRTIEQNWNVYITPRVTFNSTGITGRYLDIAPAGGTWRGIRLSLDKNADELGVVIDDTNVITAIYGYGATTDGQPLDFSSVTWTQTADHPAKPAGQKYLVDPAATAAYGRNGRPRYGFYQNSDITDPNILLQKAWESLKTSNTPAVTVNCLVRDLYRLGYADQPIRLHDTALVQIRQTNTNLQLEIIKLTVDLLNPTATRPTIGAYIPNIIYMLRQTEQAATGGVSPTASGSRGTRRGGGGGQTNRERELSEFETEILQNQYQISLRAYQRDLEHTDQIVAESSVKITAQGTQISALRTDVNSQGERIATNEARITVNATSITSEVTDRTNADNVLSSQITQTANAITLRVGQNEVAIGDTNTLISNLRSGQSVFNTMMATRAVIGGNGCDWFTVNANNGIFKLLGTYD
jgi:phage minor structural protein